MSNLDDMLRFEGVSRTVLEERIRVLVARMVRNNEAMVHIAHRVENADRTAFSHPVRVAPRYVTVQSECGPPPGGP
jgi:hypothetical protein